MVDKEEKEILASGQLDKKSKHQRLIDQANAQKNRLFERLHFDKQQNSINEIIKLLNRYSHETEFDTIRQLLKPIEKDVQRTALDFKNLEESVRKMSEKMKLKHEVLDILEAPTKIHIRSEEQKL